MLSVLIDWQGQHTASRRRLPGRERQRDGRPAGEKIIAKQSGPQGAGRHLAGKLHPRPVMVSSRIVCAWPSLAPGMPPLPSRNVGGCAPAQASRSWPGSSPGGRREAGPDPALGKKSLEFAVFAVYLPLLRRAPGLAGVRGKGNGKGRAHYHFISLYACETLNGNFPYRSRQAGFPWADNADKHGF